MSNNAFDRMGDAKLLMQYNKNGGLNIEVNGLNLDIMVLIVYAFTENEELYRIFKEAVKAYGDNTALVNMKKNVQPK